jgi:AraC family transcriptional activator of pobA
MDGAHRHLYFSDMSAGIPAFFLYGEPLRPPDERLIHVETIAARSRLHDWVIHPHRHRDLHQLLLLRRGGAALRLDGRALRLKAPALIVAPPGVVHDFSFRPETVGLVLSLSQAVMPEFATSAPALPPFLQRAAAYPLRRDAAAATDVWALADMLLREFGRSAPGRTAALRGLCIALLANLLRLGPEGDPADTGPPGLQQELVARFRAAVEHRFREQHGVAPYARELGVTEIRLRRACLAVTGSPPVDLVQRRLLLEAERQLRYTSMPVTQVAYHLGFEDPAYFSRFFTRRTGQSPSRFRRAHGIELSERPLRHGD